MSSWQCLYRVGFIPTPANCSSCMCDMVCTIKCMFGLCVGAVGVPPIVNFGHCFDIDDVVCERTLVYPHDRGTRGCVARCAKHIQHTCNDTNARCFLKSVCFWVHFWSQFGHFFVSLLSLSFWCWLQFACHGVIASLFVHALICYSVQSQVMVKR